MIKGLYTLTLLMSIFINSFSQKKPNTVGVTNDPIANFSIDPKKAIKTIDGNKLFESIEYVKLETTKKCLIGKIQKVVFVDNKFYILSSSTKQVHCFSNEGQFLFTLNKIGLGPKETGEVSDIAYDTFNEKIILPDAQKRNVYFYSLNGEFIEKISFNYFIYDILPVSKNELILRTSESGSLDLKMFSTISKKTVYESMKLNAFDDICQGYNYFSAYENIVLFTPAIADTIFEVNSKGVKCRYTVDYGKYTLPNNLKTTLNHRIIYSYYKLKKYDYAGIISFAWENNKYIGFNYGFEAQTKRIQVIVSKKDFSILQFQKVTIDGQELDVYKLFQSSQNRNYGIIDPVTVVKEVPKSFKPYGRFSKLTDVINISSDSDNPIIAIYKLKPNL